MNNKSVYDNMTDLGKEILHLANECDISYAYDLYNGIFEFNINDLKNDKEKIKKFISSCPEEYMLNKVSLEEYGREDEIEDYPDGYFYFLTPREFLENDVGMENVDLVDIDSINEGCHNRKKSKKKLKESEMRTQYCVDDSQMNEWKKICKAFANKVGAKLLFVNECSCGLEFPDGTMKHVYLDEMIDYLG